MNRILAILLLTLSFTSVAAAQEVQVEANPNPSLLGSSLPTVMQRQPDGKIIVGGDIKWIGTQPIQNLARLNSDGSLDTSWTPAIPGTLDMAALASDGNLYVSYINSPGTTSNGQAPIVRVDTAGDGSADTSFVPLLPNGVTGFSGPIVLDEAGAALYISFGSKVLRYRLADASLDAGFQVETGGGYIEAMAMVGGDLVLGGSFSAVNGVVRRSLARVNLTTGTLDIDWDPGAGSPASPSPRVYALLVDGTHVFIGGSFSNFGGGTNYNLARVSLVDASMDPAWSGDAADTLFSPYIIKKDGQGRILIYGSPNLAAPTPWSGTMARYLPNGQLDSSWRDASLKPVASGSSDFVVLSNDDVLSYRYASGDEPALVQLRDATDGLATDFSLAPMLSVASIQRVFDLGGDTLVVGGRMAFGGDYSTGAVRMDAAGNAVPGWYASWSHDLYLTSSFSAAVGASHVYLTSRTITGANGRDMANRLSLADGSLDAGWVPEVDIGGLLSSRGERLALDEANGYVYIIGRIGNGVSLARFSTVNGARDLGWNPPDVSSFQVQDMQLADGYLYLSGSFSSLGSADLPRLARISTAGDGSPDMTWRPAPDRAAALAFDVPNDWVYVGGGDQLSRFRLSDGSTDAGWSPLAGLAGNITRLVLTDDSLFVLGKFDSACGSGDMSVSAIRLYSDFSEIDPRWNVALGSAAQELSDLIERNDGSTLLAGYFSEINSEERHSVAALSQSPSLFKGGMESAPNACP